MKRRKTIGEDPLDAVVPHMSSRAAVAEPEEPKQRRRRVTFHLSVEIMDRARNAVYWEPGLTMTDLAEQGITAAVEKLEKKRGELYPPRPAELKGGRPVK
jgi:hypothetical protein